MTPEAKQKRQRAPLLSRGDFTKRRVGCLRCRRLFISARALYGHWSRHTRGRLLF